MLMGEATSGPVPEKGIKSDTLDVLGRLSALSSQLRVILHTLISTLLISYHTDQQLKTDNNV